MLTAIDWLIHEYSFPPSLVLVAGFAGGLRPGQQIGDLVLATDLADANGKVSPATWPGPGDHPNMERGRIVTVPALVTEPAEKKRLFENHQAVAVDMESAAAARLCHEKGIPFGCLRAISDGHSRRLSPELMNFLKQGKVSIFQVLRTVVTQPRMVKELWRLRKDTRLAAKKLAAGLIYLLDCWSKETISQFP